MIVSTPITSSQPARRIELGCTIGQGYLFSEGVDRTMSRTLLQRFGGNGATEQELLQNKRQLITRSAPSVDALGMKSAVRLFRVAAKVVGVDERFDDGQRQADDPLVFHRCMISNRLDNIKSLVGNDRFGTINGPAGKILCDTHFHSR
jgi:hypothetical protein